MDGAILRAIGVTAEKGMGVAKLFAYNSGYESPYLYEQNLLKENKCKGVQCPEDVTTAFTYNKAASLPNGRDLLLIYAESAAENVGEVATNVNIDTEPPYSLSLSGLPVNGDVNEAELHLQGKATDGKAPTLSSGIRSLALGLDGVTVPGKSGSCTPGQCTRDGRMDAQRRRYRGWQTHADVGSDGQRRQRGKEGIQHHSAPRSSTGGRAGVGGSYYRCVELGRV